MRLDVSALLTAVTAISFISYCAQRQRGFGSVEPEWQAKQRQGRQKMTSVHREGSRFDLKSRQSSLQIDLAHGVEWNGLLVQ